MGIHLNILMCMYAHESVIGYEELEKSVGH